MDELVPALILLVVGRCVGWYIRPLEVGWEWS